MTCGLALHVYDEWTLGSHLNSHGETPVSPTVLTLCGQSCQAALLARTMTPTGALSLAVSNLRTKFAVVGVSEAMDHFYGMVATRFRPLRDTPVLAASDLRVHDCDQSVVCSKRRASCIAAFGGTRNFSPDVIRRAVNSSAALAQEHVLYEQASFVALRQWEELRECPAPAPAFQAKPPPPVSASRREATRKYSTGSTRSPRRGVVRSGSGDNNHTRSARQFSRAAARVRGYSHDTNRSQDAVSEVIWDPEVWFADPFGENANQRFYLKRAQDELNHGRALVFVGALLPVHGTNVVDLLALLLPPAAVLRSDNAFALRSASLSAPPSAAFERFLPENYFAANTSQGLPLPNFAAAASLYSHWRPRWCAPTPRKNGGCKERTLSEGRLNAKWLLVSSAAALALAPWLQASFNLTTNTTGPASTAAPRFVMVLSHPLTFAVYYANTQAGTTHPKSDDWLNSTEAADAPTVCRAALNGAAEQSAVDIETLCNTLALREEEQFTHIVDGLRIWLRSALHGLQGIRESPYSIVVQAEALMQDDGAIAFRMAKMLNASQADDGTTTTNDVAAFPTAKGSSQQNSMRCWLNGSSGYDTAHQRCNDVEQHSLALVQEMRRIYLDVLVDRYECAIRAFGYTMRPFVGAERVHVESDEGLAAAGLAAPTHREFALKLLRNSEIANNGPNEERAAVMMAEESGKGGVNSLHRNGISGLSSSDDLDGALKGLVGCR